MGLSKENCGSKFVSFSGRVDGTNQDTNRERWQRSSPSPLISLYFHQFTQSHYFSHRSALPKWSFHGPHVFSPFRLGPHLCVPPLHTYHFLSGSIASLFHTFTLKMETVRRSKILVSFNQSTLYDISEHSFHYRHLCVKSDLTRMPLCVLIRHQLPFSSPLGSYITL